METKFKAFLDKIWPLPDVKDPPTAMEMIEFRRQVWFCNCSGNFIPELQRFNGYPVTLEYKSNGLRCAEYYKKGYTRYRVYKSGQAFLDIHIIGMLFDYVENPNISPKPTQEELLKCIERLSGDAPFGKVADRMDMYKVVKKFSTGTVHLRDALPKDILRYIASECQDGNVIDTYGYRGLGLYIKDGDRFKKVQRHEYYPIWPLKFLKRRGYRYYLKNSPCTDYDELLFENGVTHFPYGYFGYSEAETNFNKLGHSMYVKREGDVVRYHNEGEWISLTMDDDGFYNVPYPFLTYDQPNALMKTELRKEIKFRARISDHDYLVFSDEIYISDENDEDRAELLI